MAHVKVRIYNDLRICVADVSLRSINSPFLGEITIND